MTTIQKTRSKARQAESGQTSATIETHLIHLGVAGTLYEDVPHRKRNRVICARDLLCETRTKSRLSKQRNASRHWSVTPRASMWTEILVP